MATNDGTVQYRERDGSVRGRLEVSTGKIFDEKGNTIGQLTPMGDHDVALSDYAARNHYSRIARQVRHPVTMKDADGEGVLVKMDLAQTDVHIDSALPNYAAGYKLDEGVADLAMPTVLTPKASDKYFTWDAANSFKRKITNGGSGAAGVSEVNPTLSNDNYSTVAYALSSAIPTEVIANADSPLRPMQAAIDMIMDGLHLEREVRVATLLQTTGSWDSSVVSTIASGAKWNGGGSSDPVADIHGIMEKSYMPITGIVMSELAAHAFMRNSNVQKYVTYKDSTKPLPDIAEFAALLSLPPMHVARMKYISTGTTITYVWGNHVVLLHEPKQNPPASQNDVASAYTFRWNGGMAPDGSMTAGFLVRTYFDPKRGPRGSTIVLCTHNDAEKMTSKFVGGLLYNAIQ